jgi:hypothetical protein
VAKEIARLQIFVAPKAKKQLLTYARYKGLTLTGLVEAFGPLCEQRAQQDLSPEEFKDYQRGKFRGPELQAVP